MQKYFSGNYVFPSPKSSEDEKKRSFPKIEELMAPKSSKDQKRSLMQYKISMGGAKSRWGDAKCQWGDANSWWGTRFPASPQQFKYWVASPLNQAALKKKR